MPATLLFMRHAQVTLKLGAGSAVSFEGQVLSAWIWRALGSNPSCFFPLFFALPSMPMDCVSVAANP